MKVKYSNEIRGLGLLLGARYYVNKYTRLQTEQANGKWNHFFPTMCFSYNQKVRFVMYMHLQYTLWKLRFEDLAFPVWFKPYLIVLSWCSQVPLPKGKVLPLRKQRCSCPLNGHQIDKRNQHTSRSKVVSSILPLLKKYKYIHKFYFNY